MKKGIYTIVENYQIHYAQI